ncbi:hypothetical protein SAMN05216269_102260 [Flavobacterium xinjiangense]|uniref:Uncharacterized protein n=1 Tax=Flavobacterium xinjiangense TaxID=178356 RepID=A0A1M7FU58_9FLAO|nr:hypothetical protein SAMN05216269_102260 [Flavobacterium xinjiangense]
MNLIYYSQNKKNNFISLTKNYAALVNDGIVFTVI